MPRLSARLKYFSLVLGSVEVIKLIQQLDASQEATSIRIFECTQSDTFEVYGTDAFLIGGMLFKTAEIAQIGPENTSFLSISPSHLTQVLPNILREHRVEMWAFSAARKSWKLVAKASPGNYEQITNYLTHNSLFEAEGEELLGEAAANNFPILTSVIVRPAGTTTADARKVGFAYVDVSSFRLGYASFFDSESFSNVEAALIQLDAKECIFQKGSDLETSLLDEASPLTGSIVATPLPIADFNSSDADNPLAELLPLLPANSLLEDLPQEVMQALTGVVKYLGLLQQDHNLAMFTLERLDMTCFMRLDDSALRALNIFPGPTGGKVGSLFGILDHCKTKQGSRLLSQWLRQPLLDPLTINERLDAVEALIDESVVRQCLRETVLRGIPQISRITRKLVRGKASLQDLVLLYSAVSKIAPIHEQLRLIQIESPIIQGLILQFARLAAALAKFAELIESTVDFDALQRHEYIVKATFDGELGEIHARKETVLDEIEKIYRRVAVDLGLERGKKIKLERNDTYGHFLRISRLDGNLIKGDGVVYQELAALKNGIYFVTGPMREASLRYTELTREYASKQVALVQKMVSVARTYKRVFDELDSLIAKVDAFQSLAYSAIMSPIPLVRPRFLQPRTGNAEEMLEQGREMHLVGARHPCVEAANPGAFIPNDLHVSPHDGGPLKIITGPNMGGKSTYIRSIAMIALMAQSGCFVPCESALLPIFDAVMVRVGAGDSILRGISTFMMEMIETASILSSATSSSLIIIDELGRGTSTSEGLGIAWGVCRRLQDMGAMTLFATHFHELTRLPGASNLHAFAAVDDVKVTGNGRNGVTMTFKVVPGACERSFGIHVARMAGFPDVVLKMAQIVAKDLESSPSRSGDEVGTKDHQLIETCMGQWENPLLRDQIVDKLVASG